MKTAKTFPAFLRACETAVAEHSYFHWTSAGRVLVDVQTAHRVVAWAALFRPGEALHTEPGERFTAEQAKHFCCSTIWARPNAAPKETASN